MGVEKKASPVLNEHIIFFPFTHPEFASIIKVEKKNIFFLSALPTNENEWMNNQLLMYAYGYKL